MSIYHNFTEVFNCGASFAEIDDDKFGCMGIHNHASSIRIHETIKCLIVRHKLRTVIMNRLHGESLITIFNK